jgi:hypothetical protein
MPGLKKYITKVSKFLDNNILDGDRSYASKSYT